MVEAAVADVVGPAVAAHNPDGLLVEVGLVVQDGLGQLAGVALAVGLAGLGELLAEGLDLRVVARAELVDGAEVLLEGEDVVVSGGGVGFAVIVGVEPLLGRRP